MARGTLTILSRDEMDRINAASIRVLGELGVTVHSDDVCELLEKDGCRRGKDGQRMLIPEDVVKEAVASGTKKPLILAARDKKHDMKIPSSDKTFMACGGEGVYVKNLLTGKTHSATMKDFVEFTVLCEKMPGVDYVWGMVGDTEAPPFKKEIIEMRAIFENTTKHFQGGALSAEQARAMIEIASILSGGREKLEERPLFSAVQCPLSPLTFEKGVVEAQVELAKAMIPVVSMSAPIAGVTSPVTLAGTVVQTTAENLASLVICQSARRGAPFIYSSDSSPADMKSGSIDYGGLESPLLHSACGQMGRYYGLPTMVSGASIQESSLTIGSAAEGVPMMIAESLAPSDLGSGFGGIDNALGASLEQLVVDVWVWELAREFARRFESDEAAISFDTIKSVVNGGGYLSQPHTIKNFRKENVASRKPELSVPDRDAINPRGSLLKKARAEAEKLLKEPRKELITKEEKKKLDELFKKI